MEYLLPIGTVVSLQEGVKRLMIFGVKQTNEGGDNKEYDYIVWLTPKETLVTSCNFFLIMTT